MQAQPGLSLRFFANLIVVFALLSAADLYLTWKLIEAQHSEVIESNPLAARVLKEFGWPGLSVFKAGMVLLIAGVAVGVLRRCPRTGELLMVFGCGVQAAVVMTSVFWYNSAEPVASLDSFNYPRGFVESQPLPPEAMTLLTQAGVKEELKLSATQLESVQELVRLRRLLSRSARRGDLVNVNFLAATLQSQELNFTKELSASQLSRLKQLTWQHRGPLALADEDVAMVLALSEEQFEAVQAIVGRLQAADATPRGKRASAEATRNAEEESARLKDEMLAVLTPAQRAKWHDLAGKQFAFDPPAVAVTIADAE